MQYFMDARASGALIASNLMASLSTSHVHDIITGGMSLELYRKVYGKNTKCSDNQAGKQKNMTTILAIGLSELYNYCRYKF